MTSAPDAAPLVALDAVHVDFGGREAVCHVDLRLGAGALTVITGPNGAGKSTLLEVIGGIRAPSSGRATLTADAVAFVPQRAAVSDRIPLTVRDIVTLGVWGRTGPFRRLRREHREAVDAALEAVDAAGLARQPFAALSGGQRQRALLAQGLARRADLLLLDEPTTGLDAASAHRIRTAIATETARGAAVVCVSHDAAVIGDADRVIHLDAGRIVADERRGAADAECPETTKAPVRGLSSFGGE